jgi:hypothetical protein
LYSTFEDFRPGNPQAGLYLSTNAAPTWTRVPVPLPVALDKAHGTVGLAVGHAGGDHPWVLTSQGLFVANTKSRVFDSPDQWRLVPRPVTTLAAPQVDPTHILSDGEAIIACFGNTVYRATVDNLLAHQGDDSSPWVGSGGLPSDFTAQALTVPPAAPGNRRPVLVLGIVGTGSARVLEVWTVDPGGSAAARVGGVTHVGGSGRFVIAAPPRFRPDGSYDVILGDGLNFHQGVVTDARRSPQVSGAFEEIPDVHRDPWWVAFPVDYATASSAPPIYLAHPRVPGQVAAARNGTAAVYRSTTPSRRPAGGADPRYYAMRGGASGTFTGLSPEGGTEPPQIPGFAQVLTAPTDIDKPVSVGDYLTVRDDADSTGIAQILRSSRIRQLAGGSVERIWRAATTDQTNPTFAPGSILAIAASGGHRDTTIYVLHSTSTGTELLRSDLDATSGTFTEFTACSGDRTRGQPTRPKTLHVNPWNPDILYVWDDPNSSTSTIRSSADGGRTWRVEPALKARATNNGEYTFTFQRSIGDIRCGPLQSMVFYPVDSDFRLAVTFPGGLAFTRNAGQDWFNVGDDLHGVGALARVRSLRDLHAYPYSAYLTGREGEFRLYVALLGRGLVRIDTALRTAKPPS